MDQMVTEDQSTEVDATDGQQAGARAAEEIVGQEHLKLIDAHLRRLHRLYQHPNRTLHYDQVVSALLLGLFNSADRSLRMLDDLSCAEEVQEVIGQRVARSTLADAMAGMDAAHLMPIITDLMKRLPALKHRDSDLHALTRRLIAADGSIFTVPADVLWAIALTRSNGKTGRQIRLNLQLDVLQFIPTDLSISGQDEGNEADAFAKRLSGGVIYVVDRNFVDFDFLQAVLAVGSDFVVRLRKDTGFFPQEQRPLSAQEQALGIISDRIGRLSGAFGEDRLFREVVVIDPKSGKPVRFLTTLMDVSAAVIGKIYRHRWMIELFFKWLKCVAKCRHLFSQSHNGITMQLYVAVIYVLLTYLRTGRKPGVYEFNCLSWVAAGMMSVEAMAQVLARRDRERELERARRARKKAEKTN
jgi:hypothetical protein